MPAVTPATISSVVIPDGHGIERVSKWDTCNDTEGTPCDDTVLRWLHTLNRQWLRSLPTFCSLSRLAMTIFDPDRSRTVSIDFIDNDHGEHHAEKGELCSMAKDGNDEMPPLLHGVRRPRTGKPVILRMLRPVRKG